MRRIKLGKGLLRSLFPSSSKNRKKKSSSTNKNTSPFGGTAPNNTPANNGSSSSFNRPTVLGESPHKSEQYPYELHQKGASSSPPSDDEGRNHENSFGGGGVGEEELQLTSQQQQQQQHHDAKREETVITPITVACSSVEDQEEEEEEEACCSKMTVREKIAKFEGVNEATESKQLKEDIEYCVPQPTQQLTEDESISSTSPSRDDARRRAAARQQRILSQASTRFQSLSETATIDTTEFKYCSPPHLQRRRWQHHIGRQSKPQALGDNGAVSQGQSIIGLPPRQRQVPPTKSTNCSSIVFYDSTPTRTPSKISSSGNKSSSSCSDLNKKEGQIPSPTCVADVEQFGVTTPGPDTRGAASGNQAVDSNDSICTSTTTDKRIYFFVLLLCPKSRVFEVIEVSDAPLDSTVGDVLKLIPRNITVERLLKKKYIGLCRPADRTEFIDLASPAFLPKKEGQGEDNTPFEFIHENDVLVAILKGSTCYRMNEISKPILQNPKFMDIIRRRRRQSATDKVARKKMRKSKKKHNDKLNSPTKEIYVPDDCSVVSGIYVPDDCSVVSGAMPRRSRNKEMHGEDPTSLSKMLETLSMKLHEVEEDGAVLPANDNCSKQHSVATDLDQSNGRGQEGEKIGPKTSLAMELAQTIEDIFADNNVEIVAVDADDDDDDGEDSRIDNNYDTDNDTFVSARSLFTQNTHRTSSSNATRTSAKMPRNIVTRKKHRTKTSPRQFKFTETMEDNALVAQIEAMAVQADAAFEDRREKNSSRIASRTTVASDRSNNESPVSAASPVPDDAALSNTTFSLSDDAAVSSTAADSKAQDLSESLQTNFDAVSHIESEVEREDAEVVASVTKIASKDTDTSDNQGRVNEMHVLESLGCTIVCIAANYMQGNRQKENKPSIETTNVFQSATFLAFMVSGQRYLAKVTEK